MIVEKSKYEKSKGEVYFFRFRPEIPFLGKTGLKKNKNASLSLNLAPTLIAICRNQWWCYHFLQTWF